MSAALPAAQSWLDDVAAAAALAGARRVLCVDPTGDRALAHALGGAEVVALTDPAGAALLALKRAGGALAWEEHLQVLGLLPFGRRVYLYHRLRERLPEHARRFWDAHEAEIRTGALACGAQELRLAAFRERLSPWVLPEGRLRAALSGEAGALRGRRWRVWVRGQLGAEALDRLEAATLPMNPYAEWILTGRYAEPGRARVYLSPAGHAQLGAIRLETCLSWEALEAEAPFDALDLGAAPAPRWASLAAPGARVLCWGEDLALEPLTPPLPDRSPLAPTLRLGRCAGPAPR
ncbi:MAG: DUF3419 family protein [Alphaproteobacteria bacterium]|nr:DUF3419 family protein [Alphaproteobacteria bacterium]MCB9793832.1 DUF3419 family protein [Alphaproteobacteria bacterium]